MPQLPSKYPRGSASAKPATSRNRAWLQEAVRDKRVGLSKVHGPVSPANLMTKHVDHATQIRLLSFMSVESIAGRAETAPETGVCTEQIRSEESGPGADYIQEYTDVGCEEELWDWIHEMSDSEVETIADGVRIVHLPSGERKETTSTSRVGLPPGREKKHNVYKQKRFHRQQRRQGGY